MKVTVLKDVMIDAGQIDRYFEGKVPVNLWRGIKKKTGKGVLTLLKRHTYCQTVSKDQAI